MNKKNPFKSKTNWGVIIMMLSFMLSKYGIEVDEQTQTMLIDNTIDIIALIGEGVGGLLAIYGRWVANQPLGL